MIYAPRFWDSWKGRIIRAICLDGLYKRSEILKRTNLKEKEFEVALRELFQADLLCRADKDRFLVNSRDLHHGYICYFKELQKSLLDWVQRWRLQENVESKMNHFFLEDKLLYDFSERLMEHANVEILVTNPFVERCHLSNTLMSMSKKGIDVKLVTRPTAELYKRDLSEKGVSINYDESIHAKLIAVDRRVGIVSSMNFFATSSGGGSCEAGLVTIEESIVQSIARSILSKT